MDEKPEKVKAYNDLLSKTCSEQNWRFIDNSNKQY
jgi:hypothetical protein